MKILKSNQLQNVLGDLDKGDFLENASEELAKLILAVRKTEKRGSITLKISVDPTGEAFTIGGTLTSKLPQPKPLSIIRYATDDGLVSLRDPNQGEFPEVAKVVDGGQPEEVTQVSQAQ